jgi:AcrR family transcriptional regulator
MSMQRPYRGVAPDERRRKRREALLEAALDCVADESVDLGVRSICAKARLTPRYFYESFANLDELLVVLVDQVSAEVLLGAQAEIAGAPADLRSQCRAAASGAYKSLLADPRRAKAMLVVASGSELLQERRRRLVLEYADAMLSYLGEHQGADVSSSSQARATALYMVGGAFELIQSVLAGTAGVDDENVVDILGDLLAGTLRSLLTPR